MLHFPVFRLGYVIGSDPIRIDDAEKIAEAVLDGEADIRAATIALLASDPDSRLFSDAVRARTSTRRTPAIIIDFSTIDAEIEGRRVEIRSGVTVCIEQSQSKCWTRINATDQDVSRDEVDRLFDGFERIAHLVNDCVLNLYRVFIRSIFTDTLKLDKKYELNVRTVSQSDDWIEEYFRRVFAEHDVDEGIGDLKEQLDSVMHVMNSDLGEIPPPTEVVEHDGEKIRQVAVAGARNPLYSDAAFPPHTGHAIYVLKYDSNVASFTGTGYDPYIEKGIRFQESLSHVASSNVAVEYGGLF